LTEIAFLLYENMSALDAVGPYEVLDVPSPDVIVVPDGPGTMAALEDAAAVEWLRRAHETSSWTSS